MLKRSKRVNTFRESKTGRGALARDIIAVDAPADDRRWSDTRTGRTLAKMNSAAIESAEQRTLTE